MQGCRQISFAELARRGLEYILSVYAPEPGATGEWQPPKPRALGWTGLNDAEIKEQAQRTAMEAAFARRPQKVTRHGFDRHQHSAPRLQRGFAEP